MDILLIRQQRHWNDRLLEDSCQFRLESPGIGFY
nr:MAG TPA: hypothetical protein [Caudoviricetes sp.]